MTSIKWALQRITMLPKSRQPPTQFRRKHKLHGKHNVCFAETLESVHEVPYHQIYNRAGFDDRFKLPEIHAHKYTPFVYRDPNAKPSKRRKENVSDMFVNDTVKLPFIKLDSVENTAKDTSNPMSKRTQQINEPRFPPATRNNPKTGKFQIGKTLHFKYSDFILRRIDKNSSSKETIFKVN